MIPRIKQIAAFHVGAGVVVSCAVIALGAAALLERAPALVLAWTFPAIGTPRFAMTPFGGFFAVVTGIAAVPVTIWSASYSTRERRGDESAGFTIGYCALLVAIAAVLSAADVVSFIVSWQILLLAACVCIAINARQSARAAVGMLVAGELGMLAVVTALLIAAGSASNVQFDAIALGAASLSAMQRTLVGVLSFFGFGVTAGIFPFNAWLRRAYDASPPNLTALFSGALANVGLYGMVLVNVALVPQNAMLFGLLGLAFGTVSAIAGILYASIENRLKTVLAFSSIENIGIAVASVGAGGTFLAIGRSDLAALGIAAGIWYAGNHAFYKALLCLSAGTVDRECGTDNMNLLGGIARGMPVTSACFLVGALAISAIPPLNGFASEWLVLQTLLRSTEIPFVPIKIGFVLAGALLALVAALTATCFIKAFAMTFAGASRGEASQRVQRESGAAARVAMVLLACACLISGIFPSYVIQFIDAGLPGALRGRLADTLLPPFLSPLGAGLPQSFLSTFQSLGAMIGAGTLPGRGLVLLHRNGTNNTVFAMSATYIAVFALLLLIALYVFVRIVSRSKARNAHVWAGGLRPLLTEMTYTATAFSNPFRVVFDTISARPRQGREFFTERWIMRPLAAFIRILANTVARMHKARLGGYLAYALAALVIVLLIALL